MALQDHVIEREQIASSEFQELSVGSALQGQLLSFRYARNKTVLATILIDGRTASAVIGQDLALSDLMSVKGAEISAVFRGMREFNGQQYPSLTVEF